MDIDVGNPALSEVTSGSVFPNGQRKEPGLVYCPAGAKCFDPACTAGRHPPLCRNGFFCPNKSTVCKFRHYNSEDYSITGSKRNKGLIILVEMDHLLVCHTGTDRNSESSLRTRKGAFEFMYWLKSKCQRTLGIRAAFCTELPMEEARREAKVLDPDAVLHIYAAEQSKPDPSCGATMVDLAAIWNTPNSPAAFHCPYSTIVIDNNVRRMREYPNNLVFVPPFGEREAMHGESFNLRIVREYLDIVIDQWMLHSREKLVNRNIREMLQLNLHFACRRETKLLILLDLNGTLMYRSVFKLNTAIKFNEAGEDQRFYYYRPGAVEFVSFLIDQLETTDCVDIAFYSSMTGKNATAAATNLDPSRRLHVYAREFNQRDTSSENQWAVIRDLSAVWAAPGRPAFQHSARSTIMIDDTFRKLREFPDNLVQVPEFTEQSVVHGEGFDLYMLTAHIRDIIGSWQTNYSLDRDIRTILKPLNKRFYGKCADAEQMQQTRVSQSVVDMEENGVSD